jgi:hypothetical protein
VPGRPGEFHPPDPDVILSLAEQRHKSSGATNGVFWAEFLHAEGTLREDGALGMANLEHIENTRGLGTAELF